MRILAKAVVALLAIVGLASIAGAIWLVASGISARANPGRVETAVARRVRAFAIPRAENERPNPVKQTPQTLKLGMEHFADHCAVCHANDGSGETETGRGMYPRPPDMRKPATQTLSDGALHYIIENGVRFTGMPAWSEEHEKGEGEPGESEGGEEADWHLVQFIRHLPNLTPAELAQMRALNPKSPEELREQEQQRRSPAGVRQPTKPAPQPR